MCTPTSLAVMAAVATVWAGSHFFGVGEVADVALLVAGWLTLGPGALHAIHQLVDCVVGTARARFMPDLDKAAHDLSGAITTLGVDVVLALLFRGRPETFKEPYKPEVRWRSYKEVVSLIPKAGPTRMYEAKLIFVKEGYYTGQGATRIFSNTARIGRNYARENKSAAEASEQLRGAISHERVHQRITQAFSLLGRPAIYMRYGAYKKSFILRYLEEAAGEALKLYVTGTRPGELTALQFPLNENYGITIAKMEQEVIGIFLGPIMVGGMLMNASYGVLNEHH